MKKLTVRNTTTKEIVYVKYYEDLSDMGASGHDVSTEEAIFEEVEE